MVILFGNVQYTRKRQELTQLTIKKRHVSMCPIPSCIPPFSNTALMLVASFLDQRKLKLLVIERGDVASM